MTTTEEELALAMERAARPDWDVVSLYALGAKEVRYRVQELGFVVDEETNGYSVKRAGHQVAVYTLTDAGKFRWGWIELPNGRTEMNAWDEFEALLMTHQPEGATMHDHDKALGERGEGL